MLRHFGSLKRIREATVDEIAAVKGLNRELAAEIRRHLDAIASLLDNDDAADQAIEIGLDSLDTTPPLPILNPEVAADPEAPAPDASSPELPDKAP